MHSHSEVRDKSILLDIAMDEFCTSIFREGSFPELGDIEE